MFLFFLLGIKTKGKSLQQKKRKNNDNNKHFPEFPTIGIIGNKAKGKTLKALKRRKTKGPWVTFEKQETWMDR